MAYHHIKTVQFLTNS